MLPPLSWTRVIWAVDLVGRHGAEDDADYDDCADDEDGSGDADDNPDDDGGGADDDADAPPHSHTCK